MDALELAMLERNAALADIAAVEPQLRARLGEELWPLLQRYIHASVLIGINGLCVGMVAQEQTALEQMAAKAAQA